MECVLSVLSVCDVRDVILQQHLHSGIQFNSGDHERAELQLIALAALGSGGEAK